MADTGTSRSFANMLNQKPVKGQAGRPEKKSPKSPWMGVKKSTGKGC